jgi:hypothetical protein
MSAATHDQGKMHSRTWGASKGGCSCASIPARGQDESHPRFVGKSNGLPRFDASYSVSRGPSSPAQHLGRRFGVAHFSIPIRSTGLISAVERMRSRSPSRACLRWPFLTHTRSLTRRDGRYSCRTRGLQTVRIELEPAKQSADPFHVTPFVCVGFNTVTDNERHLEPCSLNERVRLP